MPARPVHIRDDGAALREGFARVREEVGVPGAFPPAAVEEARGATDREGAARTDATAFAFVTIDPEGSRDLDQAVHLERLDGGGFRVRYAIADVAAFVTPGSAMDAEAWLRGVTHYSPDGRAPLYPPELSEGAASLLPDGERPALLWTIDLDAAGERGDVTLARARVRSREQLSYATAQERIDAGGGDGDGMLGLLREVGTLREARERARGGVSLPVPEQEVEPGDGGWRLRYRAPLPVEGWNAQISLLTGLAAADLMLGAGAGILRTVPPPDEKAVRRLRATALALGAPWREAEPYPDYVRSLDPAAPRHAAILRAATGLMRGAGYAAFDGTPPTDGRHAAIADEYAHVTAPLRRLADRYANEACLAAAAGTPMPAWAREALPRLPDAMQTAGRRAGALERAVIDMVEAALLAGREGDTFRAVVIDVDADGARGTVQLDDPAVRGRIDGAGLPLGEAIDVRLEEADPIARTVRFARA